jgi:hypothetical protein
MKALLLVGCAVALGLAVAACGSSGTTSTPRPVPGGVAATASDSAPAYCGVLIESGSLLAVGRSMGELAAKPHDKSAKKTLRGAAATLRSAAGQAPRRQRLALVSAAEAIHSLAVHGLGRAAYVERALVQAGHLTEHSCAFPVG